MDEHECKKDELVWDGEIQGGESCFYYVGKCPVCGKEYQQVFTENDGLFDVEKQEYVYA